MSELSDIQVLFWSKDRPAQCDLLLRTMQEHFGIPPHTTCVYLPTLEGAFEGYLIAERKWPQVKWLRETNFPRDIVAQFGPEKYWMPLVDDIVFYRPLGMAEIDAAMADQDVLAYCPHFGLHTTYCYTTNRYPLGNPTKTKFRYDQHGEHWGYPGAMDGHIFRTEEARPAMESTGFTNMANLESLFNQAIRAYNRKFLTMPERACMVNLVVNRVQDFSRNRTPENQTPAEILQEWLYGRQIKTPVIDRDPQACHIEWTYEFE